MVPVLQLIIFLASSSSVNKLSDIVIFAIYMAFPFAYSALIWISNYERYKNGQTEFSFETTFGLGKQAMSKAKRDATYPVVSSKWKGNRPVGLCLGKLNGYVNVPVGKDGINAAFMGAPGSGKSVMLLGFLYSNMYGKFKGYKGATSDNYNFFINDIKGEIYRKLLKLKNGVYRAKDFPRFHVVQPSNRQSYGWDVFYRFRKKNITTTEILKGMHDIAEGLIEETGDNPYFSNNARKIFEGFLYFFFKKGEEFIDIVHKVMRSQLDALLKEVVEQAELEGDGIVLDKLKSFVGKDGNESIQDVEATLKTSLDVFSYPDIIYALRDNPNKTSPAVLNDGKTSIDLAIEESMLETYRIIFRLIMMQVLRHCESDFHEDDIRRTVILADEMARCGEISGLDSAMATLRSKKVSLLCFFQDASQMRNIYKKDKADAILNICELKVFLSGAGDKTTTDWVANMAGEYEETKTSYGRGMIFKKDIKYNTEKRKVVEGKDLMSLREKGEMIAIIYGEYYRFKKLQYFRDKWLKPIADEIREFNDSQMKKIP